MPSYDVVIIGAGPAGLASAWEAAKQGGKSVLVINDRKILNTRTQYVGLYPENIKYLKSMVSKAQKLSKEDEQFLATIDSTRVAIKDIERFIQNRIEELKPNTVIFQNNIEIDSIDMAKGTIEVSNTFEKQKQDTIEFQTLIGADGAKHHTANKINEWHKNQSATPPPFNYKKISAPNYNMHGVINIVLRKKDGTTLNLPEKMPIFLVSNAHKLNWNLTLDDHSYSKSEKMSIKCGFSSEIPKYLFDLINQYNKSDDKKRNEMQEFLHKEILAFIKSMLDEEFKNRGLDINEFEIEIPKGNPQHEQVNPERVKQKNKLKIQAFTTDLYEASQATYENNKKKSLVAGDAFRSPNYQIGHGTNHAFEHAKMIGLILDGKMSLEQYNKACKKLSDEVTYKTELLNPEYKKNYQHDIKPTNEFWEHLYGEPGNLEDFIKKNDALLSPAHFTTAFDIALANKNLSIASVLYRQKKDVVLFNPAPELLQDFLINVSKNLEKNNPPYADIKATHIRTLIELINFNKLTTDTDGGNLLHYLAEKNYPLLLKECISQLRKNGVNLAEALSQKNNKGYSVLEILESNKVEHQNIDLLPSDLPGYKVHQFKEKMNTLKSNHQDINDNSANSAHSAHSLNTNLY